MPIAKYTQALIDDLREHGTAHIEFGGGHNMTQGKARSRLTNAASRAGLRVRTQVVWLDSLYGFGRVVATVLTCDGYEWRTGSDGLDYPLKCQLPPGHRVAPGQPFLGRSCKGRADT